MFLSKDEIEELTLKKQRSAQAAVLSALGIIHKRREDGSVVVLRAHVEAVLGSTIQQPHRPQFVPNWEAANELSPDWQKQLD